MGAAERRAMGEAGIAGLTLANIEDTRGYLTELFHCAEVHARIAQLCLSVADDAGMIHATDRMLVFVRPAHQLVKDLRTAREVEREITGGNQDEGGART